MKIISRWRNIILRITATLILPLSFVFLSNIEISILLSGKIMHNEDALDRTRQGTASYNKISDVLTNEWTEYWLIKAVYFTFLLTFSLLSTSAVVYTIACIYSGKEITYKKVMSVVPMVWKRLMITFLCNFAILIVYNILTFLFFFLLLLLFVGNDIGRAFTIMALVAVVYFIGLVYISVIWQLASVISVLEDSYGFKAMLKSKALIKGKMGISMAIFLVVNLCLLGTQLLFEKFVVIDRSTGVVGRVGFACLSLWVVCGIFLVGLVLQTVIYFVCKSYHHENIDKSILSDHLEVYLGEYLPLKARDIQMEQV